MPYNTMATCRIPAINPFYECLWHGQILSGLELVKLQTPEEHHGINLQILGQKTSKTMCLQMLGSRPLVYLALFSGRQLTAWSIQTRDQTWIWCKVGSTSRCLGQLLCGFPRFRDSAWLDGKQWLAWNGVFPSAGESLIVPVPARNYFPTIQPIWLTCLWGLTSWTFLGESHGRWRKLAMF